jgi:hypothetical protein
MADTRSDGELHGPITGDEDDPRSDLKQAVQSRADEAKAAGGGAVQPARDPAGMDDGVSGTAGEVKNQDRNQQ